MCKKAKAEQRHGGRKAKGVRMNTPTREGMHDGIGVHGMRTAWREWHDMLRDRECLLFQALEVTSKAWAAGGREGEREGRNTRETHKWGQGTNGHGHAHVPTCSPPVPKFQPSLAQFFLLLSFLPGVTGELPGTPRPPSQVTRSPKFQ